MFFSKFTTPQTPEGVQKYKQYAKVLPLLSLIVWISTLVQIANDTTTIANFILPKIAAVFGSWALPVSIAVALGIGGVITKGFITSFEKSIENVHDGELSITTLLLGAMAVVFWVAMVGLAFQARHIIADDMLGYKPAYQTTDTHDRRTDAAVTTIQQQYSTDVSMLQGSYDTRVKAIQNRSDAMASSYEARAAAAKKNADKNYLLNLAAKERRNAANSIAAIEKERAAKLDTRLASRDKDIETEQKRLAEDRAAVTAHNATETEHHDTSVANNLNMVNAINYVVPFLLPFALFVLVRLRWQCGMRLDGNLDFATFFGSTLTRIWYALSEIVGSRVNNIIVWLHDTLTVERTDFGDIKVRTSKHTVITGSNSVITGNNGTTTAPPPPIETPDPDEQGQPAPPQNTRVGGFLEGLLGMKKPVNTTNNAVITEETANRLLDSYRQIHKKLAEYQRKPITPNNSEKIKGFNLELKQVIVDARKKGCKFWFTLSRFNKIVYTIEPLPYHNVQDVPENELVSFGIDRSYAGDTDFASECFARAAATQPPSAKLYEAIAQNYIMSGKPKEALSYVDKLKVLAPEEITYWIEYEALIAQGKYKEALACTQKERVRFFEKRPEHQVTV